MLLGVAEIDAELARLEVYRTDISTNLVALESHPGSQFLNDLPLSGISAEHWAAGAKIALIWSEFALFRDVLDRARQIRTRRRSPGASELGELTELLRGRSAELAVEEIPLEQRQLLGPSSVRRAMTVAELIATMTARYSELTRVATAADAVRSEFLPELDRCDERLRESTGLVTALGLAEVSHPLVAVTVRLGGELNRLRSQAMSDPLAVYSSGGASAHALQRLSAEISSTRTQLQTLDADRRGFEDRIAKLSVIIDEVEAAEVQAADTCAMVAAKVAAIPQAPRRAAELRVRYAQLSTGTGGSHWTVASAAVSELTEAAAQALSQAQAACDTATALLGRRDELRARLDAYRVKAAQLRLSEDAEIGPRYDRARGLLFTPPCDLAAATKALNDFQRAISDRSNR